MSITGLTCESIVRNTNLLIEWSYCVTNLGFVYLCEVYTLPLLVMDKNFESTC